MSAREIDFDRLMDATQTVIQLKPDVALTAEDVADIQYAFDCERQHEDDAVDAYSKGYAHGVLAAGGADKARLMEQVDALNGRLAVEKALNRHRAGLLAEALTAAYRFISQPQRMSTPKNGPKTATYRVEQYDELTAKLRSAISMAAEEAAQPASPIPGDEGSQSRSAPISERH